MLHPVLQRVTHVLVTPVLRSVSVGMLGCVLFSLGRFLPSTPSAEGCPLFGCFIGNYTAV